MRAVVQSLTGRHAGRRYAVVDGICPFDELQVEAGRGLSFAFGADGWSVRSAGPLRINGRLLSETVLKDRDIIGHRRGLFRFHLLDDAGSPAFTRPLAPAAASREAAPSWEEAVPSREAAPRLQSGLSTVVTAPGRWSDVQGRWYDDAVLRIHGVEHHPEELVGRLHRRIRCHVVLGATEPAAAGIDASLGEVRLVSAAFAEQFDTTLIRRLWGRSRFIALMSPLEIDLLIERLRPFGPLLGRPEVLSPLLRLPERSLLAALRDADAALLFGSPEGWEIFCCPEMLPAWRRIGLPADDCGLPAWEFEATECDTGLVRFRGGIGPVRPADVAASMARRHSLYLLFDGAEAVSLPAQLPVIHLPATGTGYPLLVSPEAGDVRFDLTNALWGRGVVAFVTGRTDREVAGLLAGSPHWLASPADLARHLSNSPGRNGLGGFEAVLLDAGDGGWTVFGDPRPVPVWRRYGLPSPKIEH
ncbi:MAG: hypothetical protein WBC44_03410 [Planctomycetaceae bacterium]